MEERTKSAGQRSSAFCEKIEVLRADGGALERELWVARKNADAGELTLKELRQEHRKVLEQLKAEEQKEKE